MKIKIGIITINDDNNYGNRLQNYALEQFLKKLNFDVSTIRVKDQKIDIKRVIATLINYKNQRKIEIRKYRFKKFNKHINIEKVDSLNSIDIQKKDYIIVGSDQIWNPTFGYLTKKELLSFVPNNKRISYAASIGINDIPNEYHNEVIKELQKFKAISVREYRGAEIIKNLTKRKDIEVLIDPTLLLTSDEWKKIEKKPKQLKTNKYILNYFLGELSNDKQEEINKIAKENNCQVINLIDIKSSFYLTNPSEFLYLERNAFLICTDSYHSCIFALIFNKPFILFDRKDQNIQSMNSRLDTLLKKFKLENRKYNGHINKQNLQYDYSYAYKILEKERKKSLTFLTKNLTKKEVQNER